MSSLETALPLTHSQANLPSSASASVPTIFGALVDAALDLEENTVQVLEQAAELQYCRQCGAEDPGARHDEIGQFYCDYCWQCWEGTPSKKAVEVAEKFPRPEPRLHKIFQMPKLGQGHLSPLHCDSCSYKVVPEDCLLAAERLTRDAPRQHPPSQPLVLLCP